MEQVQGLYVGIRLYKFGIRENIVEMILVRLLNILKTAFVKRIHKVVAGALHQRGTVRKFARKQTGEVDAKLTFPGAFWHGDRQEVQFSVQNVLICVYIAFQIVPPGLIELFVTGPAVLHRLQIVVEKVRRTEQKRPEQQAVKALRLPEVLRQRRTPQGFRHQGPLGVIPCVGLPEGNRLVFPAQGEIVLVGGKIVRFSLNCRLNPFFQFPIIHISLLKNKTGPSPFRDSPIGPSTSLPAALHLLFRSISYPLMYFKSWIKYWPEISVFSSLSNLRLPKITNPLDI